MISSAYPVVHKNRIAKATLNGQTATQNEKPTEKQKRKINDTEQRLDIWKASPHRNERLQFHFYFTPNYFSSLQLAHPSIPPFLSVCLLSLSSCLSQFVRSCSATFHLCSARFAKGKCPALPRIACNTFSASVYYILFLYALRNIRIRWRHSRFSGSVGRSFPFICNLKLFSTNNLYWIKMRQNDDAISFFHPNALAFFDLSAVHCWRVWVSLCERTPFHRYCRNQVNWK